jgi:predicted permease
MGWNWNTWYFWIPLVLAVLWEQYLGYAILVWLWALLHENTLGMYYLASKEFNGKEAIKKVCKMPTIYGFIAWSCASFAQIWFSPWMHDFFLQYKAAYVVLGMMIIWIGLYTHEKWSIEINYILVNLLQKFLFMPIIFYVGFLVVSHFFPSILPYQQTFYLISLVPIAAWTISLAFEFIYDVYQCSLCVLISTCIALFTTPIYIQLMHYLF